MPKLNDMLDGGFTKGLAIGVTAALLVPVVATALAPVLRPAARSVLKAGLRAYQRGQEALAEFGEAVEDLVAETDAELKAEKVAAAATAGGEQAAPAATAETGQVDAA